MIYKTCVRTGMMVIFLYLSSSLFDFLGVVVALDRRETKQMTNEEKGRAMQMFLQGRVAEESPKSLDTPRLVSRSYLRSFEPEQ